MKMADNEYVVHGPELLENIPNGSCGMALYRSLQEHYNLPIAMIDATTRKIISYKTIYEQSLRLAHSLQKYGIGQNDVIAISSENNLHYVYPLLASIWLGTTVTLFNPHYTLREIAHVANISKPTVIFCSKISLKAVLQIQRQLNFIKKIIIIDCCNNERDVESMESFIVSNTRDYKRFDPVDVNAQRVALILYSSGTTGLPKGVMLTHYNLNAVFVIFRDPRFFPQKIPGAATGLGLMPFYHAFGFHVVASAFLFGVAVLVIPKFEERTFLKTVQDFKLKSLSIVPPIANFLVNSNLVDDYDLSHVEVITSGGAPLSKHTEELLIKRFKKVTHIRQGYGLTEATVAAVMCPIEGAKPGSVGKLIPGTSAKVVDVNSGRTLGPGKRGELYFRGLQIMKGYSGDIISTNSAINEDGWLKTGDIGYYDEEGYFYIVDRLKELIKYKGFQVPPAELEGLLLEHPNVADAAVIGIPDEVAGEVPLAFIVKTTHQNITEEDIKHFVAKNAAPYKQLRGGVKFVQEIPKNLSGKILRKQLRELIIQKSKL